MGILIQSCLAVLPEYQNGEYLQYEESKTKGYLENSNQIIGFELGKNKIY